MSSRRNPPRQRTFDIEPDGFFVLRTPLLPWDVIQTLSQRLHAPTLNDASDEELAEALSEDRRVLRERLAELVELPELREALFVASPVLASSGLTAWRRDPDSKKGKRAEQALVRYIYRMASRATPFGLFSGCSVGDTGERTSLSLPPRQEYRRHTRPDMDYLVKLSDDLAADPGLRKELTYFPNSSLYRVGGRIRYAESRITEQGRSYHLVAVDEDEFIDQALRAAECGTTFAELVEILVRADPDGEVSEEDAEEFVEELIDAQLLVTNLSPAVTGDEPLDDLIGQLQKLDSTPLAKNAVQILTDVRKTLAFLDASGLGVDPATYEQVADRLKALPTQPEISRLFQVDLVKPGNGAVLGQEVLAELLNGLETLYRLGGANVEDPMETFREQFLERYQSGQLVPLLDVLDEEIGIGFRRGVGVGADNSPLLDGLPLSPRSRRTEVSWAARENFLLRKLGEAVSAGVQEIEFTDEDITAFPLEGLPALPDCMQATAVVAALSEEALAEGSFEIYVRGANGPSGVKLLGRFCHPDPALHECVRSHLRSEEAQKPDSVYAEVVHLPEGRLGNILCRPVLREYEIPYLGKSGAPGEHQFSVHDLLVTVWSSRVQLFSRRLGRPVIPRLTSAHNYSTRSLGIYRFLCSLQAQGLVSGIGWTWGPLATWPFLPRVRRGRAVLARACWNVRGRELEPLLKKSGTDRFKAVQEWREKRGLPRKMVYVEGDNELIVELENELSLDAFLQLVKRRPHVMLYELFPGPDSLLVEGPEGHFYHELVVPLVRRIEPRIEHRHTSPTVITRRRSFPPGSEWLYAKLFTGTASADQLLAQVVAPLRRAATRSRAIDRWFFIRYGDPHWHLRVRFHGNPATLQAEVVPRLEAAVEIYLAQGLLWKFQFDTYEREVERYGGREGIELAEKFFHADSEAVLAVVESLEGDEGADARWRLSLKGVDQLLDDFGFDLDRKLVLLEHLQSSYADEFGVQAAIEKQMANRLRGMRRELNDLLYEKHGSDHPMARGLAALDRRSSRIRPLVRKFQELDEAGHLTTSHEDLVASFAHMFTNRLLRSEGRAHELVLYDFLTQLTRSQIARGRSRSEAQPKGASARPRRDVREQ